MLTAKTLGWLAPSDQDAEAVGYGLDYRPEKDETPKRTLDRLTERSDAVSGRYGDGSVCLAEDFVSAAWQQGVNVGSLRFNCPDGFAPFEGCVSNRVKTVRKGTRP